MSLSPSPPTRSRHTCVSYLNIVRTLIAINRYKYHYKIVVVPYQVRTAASASSVKKLRMTTQKEVVPSVPRGESGILLNQQFAFPL